MLASLATTYAVPILMILLGVPLALGWVPPNGVYGFRTPAVMASPELWYTTNRFAGYALIIAGCAATIGKIFLIARAGERASFTWSVIADTTAILIVVVLSWLYSRA